MFAKILLILCVVSTVAEAGTWNDLTVIKDEPTMRFGLEIEWNKMSMAYSHKIGDYIKRLNRGVKIDPETPLDKITYWAISDGHHVMYEGIGEYKDWEIHLDGDSRCLFEFVSKPLDLNNLNKQTMILIHTLISLSKSQFIDFINNNFKVNELYKENLNYILHNMEFDQSAKLPDPQMTTTLTINEIKKCKSGVTEGILSMLRSVYTKTSTHYKGKDVKYIIPEVNDLTVKQLLSKTEYKEGGKLGTMFLIKHCEEQLGPHAKCDYISELDSNSVMTKKFECTPSGNNVISPNPAKPKHLTEPFDKMLESYKMHCVANKISNLFQRNGEIAYLIEVRQGITFRGKEEDCIRNNCLSLQQEINKNFKCVS